MGIFKKSVKDVDKFYKKRLFVDLAHLLRNKNPVVRERAVEALNRLSIDEDFKQERNEWPLRAYSLGIQTLESRKFSNYNAEIAPLLNTLKHESEKKEVLFERLKSQLDKYGLSHILWPDVGGQGYTQVHDILISKLEKEEKIEYVKDLMSGTHILTNKRLVIVRSRPGLGSVVSFMKYDSINSIKHGYKYITIRTDEVEAPIPVSEKELISNLAEYIPSLKEGLEEKTC